MNNQEFHCPHCNQSLEVPEEMLGMSVECPSCTEVIDLPAPELPRAIPQSTGEAHKPSIQDVVRNRSRAGESATISCPVCDGTVVRTAKKCRHCGAILQTKKNRKRKEKTRLTSAGCRIASAGCLSFGILAMLINASGILSAIFFLAAFGLSIQVLRHEAFATGLVLLTLATTTPTAIIVIGIMYGRQVPAPIAQAIINTSRINCHNNLIQIEAAKDAWAFEQPDATNGDRIKPSEVLKYAPDGRIPPCPVGGTYSWFELGNDPRCSVPRHRILRTRY